MSVKIERIDMRRGDHLYIKFGSHEHQICVVWDKCEEPYVQGPMNSNSKIIYVKTTGMVPKDKIKPAP